MRYARFLLLGLLALGGLLTAHDAGSQVFLLVMESPNPQDAGRFGLSLAAGDADGDGRADLLVGAPQENVGANVFQGRAYLFSSAGALIRTLDVPGPQANAFFGRSVAIGDVDGDGQAELVVGAPFEKVGANFGQGRVRFFSPAGALLGTVDTPNPQGSASFGFSVVIGDANGDGQADLLVGAPADDVDANVNQGRAYLFSSTGGGLLFTLDTPNPQASGFFGSSLAVGDTDADGRADLSVGAFSEGVGGNVSQGRVYLFSGAGGGLMRTLDSPNPQADGDFGRSLAMGDADGDGLTDLLASAPFEDVGANRDQGRAYLFSGATGGLMRTLDSPNPQVDGVFGGSLAMGDADGDGRADLLVGAPGEEVVLTSPRAAPTSSPALAAA